VIEAAIAAQFEILRLALTLGLAVLEGCGEADALYWLLLNSVELSRGGDAAELV